MGMWMDGATALCALPALILPRRPSNLCLQSAPATRLGAVQAALSTGGATPVIQESGLVDVEDTTEALSVAYSVTDDEDLRLLKGAVGEIRVAQQSRNWLRVLAKTNYDENNAAHEKLLEHLWQAAFPDRRRVGGRYTKEWGELGFQGANPATDFRGGGLLSLVVMVHMARVQPSLLNTILMEGGPGAHETSWYAYAVSSINFTADLLGEFDPLAPRCRGRMGIDLLNALSKISPSTLTERPPSATLLPDHPVVAAFGDVQCDFARYFHSKWVAKRPCVMEFNQFKESCRVQSARRPAPDPHSNAKRKPQAKALALQPVAGATTPALANTRRTHDVLEPLAEVCVEAVAHIIVRALISRILPA